MRFNLNISSKLWLGFGILLGSILISGAITFGTLVKTSRLNNELHEIATPSILALKDLRNLINQSEKLIAVWINTPTEDLPQKTQLNVLHNEDFPIVVKRIKQLSKNWSESNKRILDSMLNQVDSAFHHQHEIMLKYDQKEAYFAMEAEPELRILHYSYSSGDKFEQLNLLVGIVDILIHNQEVYSDNVRNEMQNAFNTLQNYVMYLGVIFFFIGCILAYLITKSIVTPINKLRNLLSTMGEGILPEVQLDDRQDEIGHMNRALMNLIAGLKSIVSFSKSIGAGNYQINFKPLSANDDLGTSLLLMRNNLKKVSEDDYKRNWSTGGLAKFSELLRINSDNVIALSEKLISELVSYLKANQGAIFVVNDSTSNDIFLEMKGCYAWDRQKFIDQKVYFGDGLIGQCWQERDSLYITDIPKDYIYITSGLGKALPKSILLVPMVSNDVVYGVLEIASFQEIQDYEIDFVKRLAESTATTIESAKVNEKTKRLLIESQSSQEQLDKQREAMKIKQSEMDKRNESMSAEVNLLKKEILELKQKHSLVRDENEVLQNLVLKLKKEK